MKDRLNDRASVAFGRLGYLDQRMRDAKREAWWWLDARAGIARGRKVIGAHAVIWTHPAVVSCSPWR